MSVVNPLAREISAKIVYYGPGLSGKTTSLKSIYEKVKPSQKGQMITLATEGDRTIFFDFLPIHVDKVRDLDVRLQLYTVPGQVFYASTRRLVLDGADAVIFVADSQPQCKDSNLESLRDLYANLEDMGVDRSSIPIVFQYNKRDLPNARPVQELSAELNPHGYPEFETAASHGKGISSAWREAVRGVIKSLWDADAERKKRNSLPTRVPNNAKDSAPSHLSDAIEQLDPKQVSRHQAKRSTSAGVSFIGLWEGADANPVVTLENQIREGQFSVAVHTAALALAELLNGLPGPKSTDGPKAQAMLLGLDGREYLRLCRLASLPAEAVSHEHALFALYMLVGARLKVNQLQV